MNYSKENLFSRESDLNENGQKLFSDDQEDKSQEVIKKEENGKDYWNVLVVDDEEDIHSVTRLSLKGFVHLDKEIKFFHAYSGVEAKAILKENHDIALILLDVVMETNHAGLEVVKYVRSELNNNLTQIVLRTGYPGQAPEREVIVTYEINDYKTKTELTAFKLFTVTLASIRAYNSLMQLDDLRINLENKVQIRTLELEKKNIKIMEMDQMKTKFFSNISHEFRTPLTLILGPLEDMLINGVKNESERDTIEMMHRNGLRILGLINQLLDLSKIDAGSLKLELIEYDILKVIRMIARSFMPLAERKKIQYTIEIPENELLTFFDYDKTEKIITNLLSNAFKFTPENSNISCLVTIINNESENRKEIEIVIKDTGPGIPQEQLGKIFDRFYQVEAKQISSPTGTGIGLSLSKELATLLHGHIMVKSTSAGSEFTFSIPLGKDHLAKHEYQLINTDELKEYPTISKIGIINTPTIEENSNQSAIEKDSILIIDDNDDIRQHIKTTIHERFNVYEAANGKQGLDLAIKHIPDLVVVDWMMPEMEGVEVCRLLKENELTSHIPVIMLTAKADIENKVEGLETGADDYITKPFNSTELNTRIKNLIAQRRKLIEKYGKHHDIEPEKVAVNSKDELFLKRAKEIIEKYMGDCEFDVNTFFPEMGMSRMQLFRKTKAITNQSPSELIRNYRLKRAAHLLESRFGNIAEVTYEVGFNNLSYFAKCFKEKYGVSPSEYVN